MPEISRFYGIIIYMWWKDHNPPHIHVSYGDYDCNISIKDKVVKGEVPAKIISKVVEWIDLHEDELLDLWDKAQNGGELNRIKPLE